MFPAGRGGGRAEVPLGIVIEVPRQTFEPGRSVWPGLLQPGGKRGPALCGGEVTGAEFTA